MGIFRTKSSDRKYRKLIAAGLLTNHGCQLCRKVGKEAIKNYKYWSVVKNDFPWDRIAKVHHMIIPKRHVTEDKLTKAELKEYFQIKKNYLLKTYENISESTHKTRTIPSHFHLQLIVIKD